MADAVSPHTLTLMDPAASRELRLQALRELVSEPDSGAVAAGLRSAAAAPHSADILPMLVRAFGGLTAAYLPELAGYLDHPDLAVVQSATRAMLALDATLALTVLGPALRRGSEKAGSTIARVLAERAPNEARRAIEELARSASSRRRMVALAYLKRVPIQSVLPLLLDMFRRDPSDKVRRILLRLVAQRITPDLVGELAAFRADLVGKLDELDRMIAHRGLALAAVPPPARTDAAPTPRASSSVTAPLHSQPLAAPLPAQPLTAPLPSQPPTAPLPSQQPAAPLPAQQPAAPLPSQQPAASLAPRPAAPSTPTPAPPRRSNDAAIPAAWRRWLPLAPTVLGLVVLAVVVLKVLAEAGGTPTVAASPRADPALGTVGARIEFTGEIQELELPQRRIRVLRDGRVSCWIRFAALELTGYRVGQRVHVEGVVRDIKADRSLVLLGLALRSA